MANLINMKVSKRKTRYILTKAYSNSEWDEVSHCLIELTEWKLHQLKMHIDIIKQIPTGSHFLMLTISSHCQFLVLDFSFDNIPDGDWCYVKNLPKDFDFFKSPEQPITGVECKIYRDCVEFCGSGKHTGEEFRSSEIRIADIFK